MNITDGLDGLALGIASIAFAIIAGIAWSRNEHGILASSLVLEGACLGTLVFNRHPAKVFMGDTGSLLLGGAIATYMVMLHLHVLLGFILLVCYGELASVAIQLSSLRWRGRKVFLIAPFHHHLEKLGWKETRIVHTFWLVTLASAAAGCLLQFGAWE